MKKLYYFTLILAVSLFSCKPVPEAFFSVDDSEPEVGQKIYFTNESKDGVTFEWDFGDGYGSNEENPVYIYTGTGTFDVILTVIAKNGLEDQAILTVNVKIPTLLEIEVVEWESVLAVPDASIYLYPNLDAWEDQTDMFSEAISDDYGFAVFSHLDPFVYYVDVWATNHDNYTLAIDDLGFIRTPQIMPNRINRFVAWVDFVDHGKGNSRGTRDIVIKKLERKASDVKPPFSDTGTENWQELYKRSVSVN